MLFQQSGGSSLIESHDGILMFRSEQNDVADSMDEWLNEAVAFTLFPTKKDVDRAR